MEKQTLTQNEFSTKLAQELAAAGKAIPKDIFNLDMSNAESDPIGWMMRNIMRMELARITLLRSIYAKFKENNDKRNTADLIISSSRTFAAAMTKDHLLAAAGKPEDLEKFAFIVGIDPDVLRKDLVNVQNPNQG
jgi:tRNA A37 threonylcarbamoyladenosine dehydratase